MAQAKPITTSVAEAEEQLRALHHGHGIHVVLTEHEGIEINTANDYRRFVAGGAS